MLTDTATEFIYEQNLLTKGHYVFKIEFTTIYGNSGVLFATLEVANDIDEPNSFYIMIFMVLHLFVLAVVVIFLIICM